MDNLLTNKPVRNIIADISDIKTILEFGNEVMEQMKNISRDIALKIETKPENKEFMTSLAKALSIIDYQELKTINVQNENILTKTMNFITKSKNKLIVKYEGVATNLDRMYLGIKNYQSNLNTNNIVLIELKDKTQKLTDTLTEYIKYGKDILLDMKTENEHDLEKKHIMSQKIQDLEYSLIISNQTIGNINIMLKTNYTIYKKLVSVYSTTIPIIQNQINMFKISKEHNDMICILETLDDKRNELIKLGSIESVKLAKKATDLLGYKQEDFELVKDAVSVLQQGLKDILIMENQKIENIKHLLESDRNEGV